jgi:hypothetical protein
MTQILTLYCSKCGNFPKQLFLEIPWKSQAFWKLLYGNPRIATYPSPMENRSAVGTRRCCFVSHNEEMIHCIALYCIALHCIALHCHLTQTYLQFDWSPANTRLSCKWTLPHVTNFDRTRCLAGCEESIYLGPGRLR